MRILHILEYSLPRLIGYSVRSAEILKGQNALGWETVQLTSPAHTHSAELGDQPVETETVDGWVYHRTPAPRVSGAQTWRRDWVWTRATMHRLAALIRETRPHILHAHSPVWNAIAALRFAPKLPVVYEMRALWEEAAVSHGTTKRTSARYRTMRFLETWSLKRAAAVTTICDGLRQNIVARGVDEDKVTVIPNAANPEAATPRIGSPPGLAGSLGLSGATVFGFTGSFYAYEGLDLLIRALPAIISALPTAKVVLVGGRREERRLRELTRRLSLEDRIVFTGQVPYSQVHSYYDLIDVLVYPRRSMPLTEVVTPLKPLEAMARGAIAMCSNVGGHRELIEDGKTGFLFKADSMDALVQAVRRVVARRDEWPTIRENARTFIRQSRSWHASVSKYAEVYERVTRDFRDLGG